MSLEDLNTMYDKLAASADKETDADKGLQAHRDAAVQYCKALAEKSTKFTEIVKAVFGDDYATEIGNLYPSEIKSKIEELKAKALELGDANELTLDATSWGNIPTNTNVDLAASRTSAISYIDSKLQPLKAEMDSAKGIKRAIARVRYNAAQSQIAAIFGSADYASAINNMDTAALTTAMQKVNGIYGESWKPTAAKNAETTSTIVVAQGANKTFNIKPSFTGKDGNTQQITSDRIIYKSSNTNLATVDANGNVTINGSNVGTYTVTLTVMVDGVEVGTNTITVKCQENMDMTTVNANFEGKSIAEHLSAGNTAICLSGFATWNNAKSNAKGAITNYVNRIMDTLKTAGFDAERLQKAATTTINYYTACIDAIYDHGADSKYENYNNLQFSYLDADGNTHAEDTKYSQKTRKREKDAG